MVGVVYLWPVRNRENCMKRRRGGSGGGDGDRRGNNGNCNSDWTASATWHDRKLKCKCKKLLSWAQLEKSKISIRRWDAPMMNCYWENNDVTHGVGLKVTHRLLSSAVSFHILSLFFFLIFARFFWIFLKKFPVPI